MDSRTIIDMAREILNSATLYSEFCSSNGIPKPSFAKEAFPEPWLPLNIIAAREAAVANYAALQDLISGPIGIVRRHLSHVSLLCFVFDHEDDLEKRT